MTPETGPAVGVVPLAGRGSMPFALLHGEPLATVASRALADAGVRVLDASVSWAEVRARRATLVVHDPLCPGTPASFLAEAVRQASERDVAVVAARPVTDTVATVDPGGVLGSTVDRTGLRAVVSPVVLPAAVVGALAGLPSPGQLADLADLVVAVRERHDIQFLAAPPAARRVADESDLRLLEALLWGPRRSGTGAH